MFQTPYAFEKKNKPKSDAVSRMNGSWKASMSLGAQSKNIILFKPKTNGRFGIARKWVSQNLCFFAIKFLQALNWKNMGGTSEDKSNFWQLLILGPREFDTRSCGLLDGFLLPPWAKPWIQNVSKNDSFFSQKQCFLCCVFFIHPRLGYGFKHFLYIFTWTPTREIWNKKACVSMLVLHPFFFLGTTFFFAEKKSHQIR